MEKISVLFVCLGNICRSPMAEGIFLDLVQQRGLSHRFHIDSAGTSGFHEGEKPDLRMRRTAREHGIELNTRSRPVRPTDLTQFHHILVMDGFNLKDMLALAQREGHGANNIQKMRDYDPENPGADVPDPYYGGDDGFEEVFQILKRTCERFLTEVLAKQPG